MKLEKNEIAEPVALRFRSIWKKGTDCERNSDTRCGEKNDAIRNNVFFRFFEKISQDNHTNTNTFTFSSTPREIFFYKI